MHLCYCTIVCQYRYAADRCGGFRKAENEDPGRTRFGHLAVPAHLVSWNVGAKTSDVDLRLPVRAKAREDIEVDLKYCCKSFIVCNRKCSTSSCLLRVRSGVQAET